MNDSNKAKVDEWMAVETLTEQLVPLLKHYDVKNRGHGAIYVDHEHYNIATAHRVLADLSDRLGVPIQLVRSRLIELGLLNDARSTLPVRNNVTRVVEKLEFWEADMPAMDDPEEDDWD